MPNMRDPPRKVIRSKSLTSHLLSLISEGASIPDSDEQRSNSTIPFIPSESCGISLQQWCCQAEVSRTPCLICRYAFSDVRRHTFYTSVSPRHLRGLNLAHDPRLFFAGAPSHLHNDFVACVTRQVNREAKRSGCRSVSWVPAGVGAITKVEEIRFPDGRVYKLKTTTIPDPEYSLSTESFTQKSSEPLLQIPISLQMKDASKQVSTKQTFSLE